MNKIEDINLQEIANTIRGLSMDGVAAANSGHPGLPLGMADVATVLWTKFLKHNPNNPDWFDRDRFILSAGHGSMLVYSLLHLYGYHLPIAELKKFRQWESKTPGHPEYYETPGVETTTGPLGQGISNGVGMALAEASLAARFNQKDNPIVDHYTYVIASDGDLEEGISHEACAFAGHNKLAKLIVLYDNNNITIDGAADLSYSDDVAKRFEAYNWQVQKIDGHDMEAIERAINNAKNNKTQASIIICDTTIGFGSPNRAGTSKAHGEPFPEEEIKLTKENLGLPVDKHFYVSSTVQQLAGLTKEKGMLAEENWELSYERFQKKYPKQAKQFDQCLSKYIPEEVFQMPKFEAGKSLATRAASGAVLNYIAPLIPSLLGGSADLTPSNKTFPKGEESFSAANPTGRYIHYGIREHGMGGIMNGLALHGGILPYSGTFFVFSDYMRPAIRMAALMEQQAIYVLTHDSIGLGEDGPTHQPIAHLASFRAMPNVSVIRPMDANETIAAWNAALQNTTGPSCIVLSRQKLPIYNRAKEAMADSALAKFGAYVLMEDKDFDNIIIATGSEVEIAVNAKKLLNENGFKVRVVSMPSTDIFDRQSEAYRNQVLPNQIRKRVAVEAGASLSWYKYTGLDGKIIGLDHFGASAPYQTLYQKMGLTPEAVANAVIALNK
ncbi:MAG TPA: transketolase [Saprospiraceae bacterium]|nr:transketolase [Saprospiraceae bacterium]